MEENTIFINLKILLDSVTGIEFMITVSKTRDGQESGKNFLILFDTFLFDINNNRISADKRAKALIKKVYFAFLFHKK